MPRRERYTHAELKRLVPRWSAVIALGVAVASATVLAYGGAWQYVVLGILVIASIFAIRVWQMFANATKGPQDPSTS